MGVDGETVMGVDVAAAADAEGDGALAGFGVLLVAQAAVNMTESASAMRRARAVMVGID